MSRHAAPALMHPAPLALLEFARAVRGEIRDLKPRDMIDIQSFIWVQGSDEY
jgi:hypothetical protein